MPEARTLSHDGRAAARGATPAAHEAGTIRPISAEAPRTLGAGRVRLTGGLLEEWQRRNREATIPHAIAQLTRAGNLDNLRAIAEPEGALSYRGKYPFLDTDVYKTLEGLVYEIARDPQGVSDEIRDFAETAIRLIAAAQREDGYLNSYFQAPETEKEPWEDLAWGHELYNLGHLIQAAVAASRLLEDDRLLDVSRRFADLVWERFGPDGENAVDAHPEVEMALVELARQTGERRYLELAKIFVDRRGHGSVRLTVFGADYSQDHQPLRELDSVSGHAVRMMYLAAGAEDVALELGEPELRAALDRLWDDMVATKLYFSGGLGSRHSDEAIGDRYELPSERSYSESCAAIGTMQWAWRQFLRTGEAKLLDVYERVLFNAFAVGISADGRAFFYDNPLQRRHDHLQRSGAEVSGEWLRRSWFGCPCCPPNIIRWVSELQDHLAVVRTGDEGPELQIGVFANSEIAGGGLEVSVGTDYPWDGRIAVRVRSSEPGARGLSLRVPEWCDAPSARLNGNPVDAVPVDGWLRLRREWAAGDELELELPMAVRAHASHPKLDATRGAITIARGPVVYCVESRDAGCDVDDLLVSSDAAERASLELRRPVEEGPEVICLEIEAARDTARSPVLYPRVGEEATPQPVPLTVEAVPYFLWGNRGLGSMRVWLRRA